MRKIAFIVLSLIVSTIIISTVCSCEKDSDLIDNPITQADNIFTNTVDTRFLTDTLNLAHIIPDTLTTFILIRHAEDEDIGTDPNLSTAGIARTETLLEALEDISLNAVYSTSFNRTVQTAEPVAIAQSLPIENYNPFNLDPLVDEVLEHHFSEVVLIVGHSDTTPALLNILVGENIYEHIPDTEFNNMFIVSVLAKGEAQVIQLKYGE